MSEEQIQKYEQFASAAREWWDKLWVYLSELRHDDPVVIAGGMLVISAVLLLLARYHAKRLPFRDARKVYKELTKAIGELRHLLEVTTSLDKASAERLAAALDRVSTLAEVVKKPGKRRSKLGEELPGESDQAPQAVEEEGFEPGRADEPAEGLPPAAGERTSVEQRLEVGLQKARSGLFGKMRDLLEGRGRVDGEFKSSIEELLISSDFGVQLTQQILLALDGYAVQAKEIGREELIELVSKMVEKELESSKPARIDPTPVEGRPKVILVVGVNGVGKTTTIGKLGYQFSRRGAKVVFAACDTFRAAADEQLVLWAKRANAEIIRGDEGVKPTTVAYEAVHRAKEIKADVILVDTAGRLHNKVNLMNELEAVSRIIQREQAGAPHEVLLVIDGSTGQNALNQAREFNERTKLSGLVLTKLDGTAKGGIVVAIKKELGVPIRYIGVGEGVEDLREFSPQSFCAALFTEPEESEAPQPSTKVAERRARRSRRSE